MKTQTEIERRIEILEKGLKNIEDNKEDYEDFNYWINFYKNEIEVMQWVLN